MISNVFGFARTYLATELKEGHVNCFTNIQGIIFKAVEASTVENGNWFPGIFNGYQVKNAYIVQQPSCLLCSKEIQDFTHDSILSGWGL